jgi:hypothetical protein
MGIEIIGLIGLVFAAAILVYALREKGDVSASMSIGNILDFKLDAKEKRGKSSEAPRQ